MDPSEVRRRVLDDHAELRERIDRLEKRALGTQLTGTGLMPLCREAEALFDQLGRHMRWEELHLRPALLDADAWGEERAALLEADHREQREVLARAMCRLRRDALPAERVAGHVLGLLSWLSEDMAREEELLLDERVLRDDVVSVEMEAG